MEIHSADGAAVVDLSCGEREGPKDRGPRTERPRGKLERYCLLPLRGLLVAKQYLDCTCMAANSSATVSRYHRTFLVSVRLTRMRQCAQLGRLVPRTRLCMRMRLRVLARVFRDRYFPAGSFHSSNLPSKTSGQISLSRAATLGRISNLSYFYNSDYSCRVTIGG